jgi:hypothetical protein
MAAGDDYRTKAIELFAKASCETDHGIRSELESLALAYLRLAIQAERNSTSDLFYEAPPTQPSNEDREC